MADEPIRYTVSDAVFRSSRQVSRLRCCLWCALFGFILGVGATSGAWMWWRQDRSIVRAAETQPSITRDECQTISADGPDRWRCVLWKAEADRVPTSALLAP